MTTATESYPGIPSISTATSQCISKVAMILEMLIQPVELMQVASGSGGTHLCSSKLV
uniref:Uncharacterized protein n=1 Tax=Arundo donax TaxID=35708 RepID=A0A0A9FJ60_ARUDO